MRDIAATTVADDEQGQRGWWRLETRSEGAEDAEPDRAGYIYGLRSEGPDYRQTRFRKCLASVCPLENRVFYVQSLSVPDLWAVVSSAECCASPEDSDPWPISPDRVLQYIRIYLVSHTRLSLITYTIIYFSGIFPRIPYPGTICPIQQPPAADPVQTLASSPGRIVGRIRFPTPNSADIAYLRYCFYYQMRWQPPDIRASSQKPKVTPFHT